MISEKLKATSLDQHVKIFAIPDLSVHCTVWDGRLREVFEKLRAGGFDFNTQGTNASAERWVVNLRLTETVRSILAESQVDFDVENHFPVLY